MPFHAHHRKSKLTLQFLQMLHPHIGVQNAYPYSMLNLHNLAYAHDANRQISFQPTHHISGYHRPLLHHLRDKFRPNQYWKNRLGGLGNLAGNARVPQGPIFLSYHKTNQSPFADLFRNIPVPSEPTPCPAFAKTTDQKYLSKHLRWPHRKNTAPQKKHTEFFSSVASHVCHHQIIRSKR